MKLLIVVDMQNDFIDGSLGTAEAQAIVPYVKGRIADFDGRVVFTRDTHEEDTYPSTQEGRKLPVMHCVRGTHGWHIREELQAQRPEAPVIDKETFGARALIDFLRGVCERDEIEQIEFLGLCTDICVISNVLLVKAYFPEIPLVVDARGCAGVTPESHATALSAMRACQVTVTE
ncbi:MAG: cysteine hydrolase [Clostridia bacterium]|nr:cysteine hydrolase [Clostridia bacterium]